MRKLVPVALIVAVVLAASTIFTFTYRENPSPPTNAVHVSIIPDAASYATGYDPDNVTVVIGINNTVIWTNNDNEPHTVTATDGSFDSGNMNPGAVFVHTFTSPGSYTYICTYHPWMRGFVTVLQVG